MPRKLPWAQAEASTSASRSRTPLKRERQKSLFGNDEGDSLNSSRRPRKVARTERNPSSSPPAQLPPPPSEELMKEGLDADDIWIMVEDEFNTTASLFTRHIHHAEYKRSRELAKAHNAAAISDIAMPTDPRYSLSNEAKKRVEATALAAKQKKALEPYAESEDTDDELWSLNPTLADLMSQPKELSSRLASVTRVQSSTRAAAGYAKAKSDVTGPTTTKSFSSMEKVLIDKKSRRQNYEIRVSEDEDYDDLDTPAYPTKSDSVQTQKKPLSTGGFRTPQERNQRPDAGQVESLPNGTYEATTTLPESVYVSQGAKSTSVRSVSSSKTRQPIPDLFDDFPARRAMPESYAERLLAKRKADMAKKEQDTKPKSVTLDQIPTFLI
ncbi:hypothetical protein NA57DRAFT_60640 [Rhizodiscina lignyota]|uniref:Uncharacterized protein n=1 Tax=Rhizodiscina lignyota TaxID=1504668 RepID=A0A9P4M2J9_9PEZI|nr:hypothetical protein NA57DRAFT_60640 [Rhizodiscina lignyota]